MNVTGVTPLLFLPILSLLRPEMEYIVQRVINHQDWKIIRVSLCHSTQTALINEVIQFLASHYIPVAVTNGPPPLDSSSTYSDSLQMIFSNEIQLMPLEKNMSNQRIYFLDHKSSFVEKRHEVKGKILILFWRTGQKLCRNPLSDGQWVKDLQNCFWATQKNQNHRPVRVFVKVDANSQVEKNNRGLYHLTGFQGIVLNELMKYLNVSFKYIIPRSTRITQSSPFRKWKTFIEPFKGAHMGYKNGTLTDIYNEDKV